MMRLWFSWNALALCNFQVLAYSQAFFMNNCSPSWVIKEDSPTRETELHIFYVCMRYLSICFFQPLTRFRLPLWKSIQQGQQPFALQTVPLHGIFYSSSDAAEWKIIVEPTGFNTEQSLCCCWNLNRTAWGFGALQQGLFKLGMCKDFPVVWHMGSIP